MGMDDLLGAPESQPTYGAGTLEGLDSLVFDTSMQCQPGSWVAPATEQPRPTPPPPPPPLPGGVAMSGADDTLQ